MAPVEGLIGRGSASEASLLGMASCLLSYPAFSFVKMHRRALTF